MEHRLAAIMATDVRNLYALAVGPNVGCWLKADIQSPEIEVRLAPNNGHSEAHAGLPLLTRLGHSRRCRRALQNVLYED